MTPRKALDRAVAGSLVLEFANQDDAKAFRHACYVVRGRARHASRKAFPDPNDPGYDRSPWDGVRIDLVGTTLRFRDVAIIVIEEDPTHPTTHPTTHNE